MAGLGGWGAISLVKTIAPRQQEATWVRSQPPTIAWTQLGSIPRAPSLVAQPCRAYQDLPFGWQDLPFGWESLTGVLVVAGGYPLALVALMCVCQGIKSILLKLRASGVAQTHTQTHTHVVY